MDKAFINSYLLTNKGIKARQIGFAYLADTIELVCEEWGRCCHMWRVYDTVAKRYDSSAKAIDRCMRYTLTTSGYKPPVSDFIIKTADELLHLNK